MVAFWDRRSGTGVPRDVPSRGPGRGEPPGYRRCDPRFEPPKRRRRRPARARRSATRPRDPVPRRRRDLRVPDPGMGSANVRPDPHPPRESGRGSARRGDRSAANRIGRRHLSGGPRQRRARDASRKNGPGADRARGRRARRSPGSVGNADALATERHPLAPSLPSAGRGGDRTAGRTARRPQLARGRPRVHRGGDARDRCLSCAGEVPCRAGAAAPTRS